MENRNHFKPRAPFERAAEVHRIGPIEIRFTDPTVRSQVRIIYPQNRPMIFTRATLIRDRGTFDGFSVTRSSYEQLVRATSGQRLPCHAAPP